MRCIETSKPSPYSPRKTAINYNMRCIETTSANLEILLSCKINYNMRCIETPDGTYENDYIADKLQHEMY